MTASRFVTIAILLCTAAVPTAVEALGNYDFLSAPDIKLNRIFRVDKATGEVGACQFGFTSRDETPIGFTLCYPPGKGAGVQGASDYTLVSSHHQEEGGVWRVDLRAGTISSCYVLNEAVVCTPPAK